MLTPKEIETALFQSADEFVLLAKKKEYFKAKRCYKKALAVADMVQLDPEKMDKLFGSRQVEPPIIGAFPEDIVQKVMQECFPIEKESEETEAEIRRIQKNRKSGKQVMEECRQQFWQNQKTGSQMIEDLRKELQ